jgi:alanine dehydrogenase
MRIGVAREIKDGERRVAITPEGALALVAGGHDVVVCAGAGEGAGFDDRDYAAAGAHLVEAPAEAFACELVVKVKELQPPEWPLLAAGSTVIGFAQLNRDAVLLDAVLRAGVRTIAFEGVRDAQRALPILAPMSRIAGRLAPFVAQEALSGAGGSGVLLAGVDEVAGARVVVIGAGNVGAQAARMAASMGACVVVFSRGAQRLAALDARSPPSMATHLLATPGDARFDAAVAGADVVIGAVLEPGRLSPKIITRSMLRTMRRGSVLVDVGIDQGGIAETSRMTTLSSPTYVDEGVVHSCVANLPARVTRTATLALAAAALPYVRRVASLGLVQALREDEGLAAGVMTWDGDVVHAGLAGDTGRRLAAKAWRHTGAA